MGTLLSGTAGQGWGWVGTYSAPKADRQATGRVVPHRGGQLKATYQ